MKLEDGLIYAQNQVLDSSSPGNQALADFKEGQAREQAVTQNAEADAKWRDAGSPVPNYDYRAAHAAGADIAKGDLPNKFVEPGSRNVGGYDLATNTRFTSVVSKDYQGLAAHGAGQLFKSSARPGKEPPPADTLALGAFAAAYQGSGKTFEEFASDFAPWGDLTLNRGWRAGTDSLRHQKVSADLSNNAEMLGIYQAQSTALPFDVRMADAEFQKSAKTIFKHFNGYEFQDTDAAASKWLATHLRNLDWNTPLAAAIFLKAKNAPWEVHQAYGDALQMWEQTNMESRILPQLGNASRAIMDPANLMGGAGKLFVASATRFAFKNFMTSMAAAAFAGTVAGTVGATARAGVQGDSPTGGELALGAAAGVGMAYGVPAILSVAGKGIRAGVNALKGKAIPELPPGNVVPYSAALEGEHIPASSGIYGEITLPNRAGDKPVRTTPQLEAPAQEPAPASLEQRPWEGTPGLTDALPVTEGQADEMLGGPPVAQVQGAEAAAEALPVETARPTPPRDPVSRVFIDPATGYYSPIQKAVADAKSSKQTPEQWLNGVIKKAPFFKQDELAWLDLEKFFKGKESVTKEELLAHIDANLVKIQRYPLVPQRRNTLSWEQHLTRSNPEYGKLQAEKQEQLDLLDLSEGEAASAHTENAIQLDLHMKRVAAEERKLALQSGEIPPGVHGIEHMLTEFDTGTSIMTREILDRIFKSLDSERKDQAALTQARSPAMIAQLNRNIADYHRAVQDNWKDLEVMASQMGAIVRPQDLERVEGMMRYGDPEVRDYSILGAGMRGTQYTDKGVDPIAHQISLHRHPEGLQASGASGHPGSDEPGTLGWAITSERNLANGETITFTDEVQADLAKERRRGEKEYKEMKPAADADPEMDFDGADALRKSEDYDDYVWQTYLGILRGRPGARTLMPKLPEHWRDATPAQRDAMLRVKDVWGLDTSGSAEDVPAMPKQIFYSTAQSNILKSELYHAAVQGKDNFGWATTGIIQDRYGERPQYLQGQLNIRVLDTGGIMIQTIGPEGYTIGRSRGATVQEAYDLADKVGGDAGAAFRKQVHQAERLATGDRGNAPPDVEITVDKPVVLKPGAFWAYDVQMVKDMRKFVEKWGGKVEQADMPVAPGSAETVKVWTIKIDDKLRKKLLERGVPIGAEAATAVGLAAKDEPEAQDNAAEEAQER